METQTKNSGEGEQGEALPTGDWQERALSAEANFAIAVDSLRRAISFAEWGWTIIANAHGGNWHLESKDWQEAAARYRDRFHDEIRHLAPSSTVAGAQEKEDRLKRALKAIWDFSANASPSVDLLNSISETCCRALSDAEKTLEKPEASADNIETVLQKALSWLNTCEHQSRSCRQPMGTGGTRCPCVCGLTKLSESIQQILPK